jgi:hypothetical protein
MKIDQPRCQTILQLQKREKSTKKKAPFSLFNTSQSGMGKNF